MPNRNKILLVAVVFAILAVIGAWQLGYFNFSPDGLRVYNITCQVVAYNNNPQEMSCEDLPWMGMIDVSSQ